MSDPLFHAAWAGDVAALRTLLDSGQPLPDRALDSALEAAAYNAQPAAVSFLLDRGADPDTTHAPTGETVLHQVITKTERSAARTEIVRHLLQRGAAPNRSTVPHVVTQCFMRDIRTRGETPLHRAAAYGDAGMVSALLAAGADKSATDINGESPLAWASWHLRENDILRLLLYGPFEGTIP